MKKFLSFTISFCVYFFFHLFSDSSAQTINRDLRKDRIKVYLDTLDKDEASRVNPSKLTYPSVNEMKNSLYKSKKDSKNRFHMSLGYNANHMHYKEFSGDDTLDEDYGKLKGYYITLGYRSKDYLKFDDFLVRPFIEGYFRRFDEIITYDGATSAGNPFMFDEKQKIFRMGVKLGAYKDFEYNCRKGEFFGYFDIGRRIWQRGENGVISGVLVYAEKYWWTYFGLGGGLNYNLIPDINLGIDIEFMFSGGSLTKMRADLYEGGTFDLGNVFGVEVKLPIKYYILHNLSFDLIPYFTYWDIGESNYVEISGTLYIEPDSKTHIEGVLMGLTYTF